MIDNHTIQTLQGIVAELGSDRVCEEPKAFAAAILDMCDLNDVKLLTNVLRANYGTRLMEYFRSGSGDVGTWTQQKTFLIDESGMSVENAESVLDALWKAMGWQRPGTSQFGTESGESTSFKVDEKYRREIIKTTRLNPPTEEEVPRKVDEKYKKEVIDTSRLGVSAGKGGSRKADDDPKGGNANTSRTNTSAEEEDRSQGQRTSSTGNKGNRVTDSNAGTGVEVTSDSQPQSQEQQGTSKWVPVLISAVWLFIAFMICPDDGAVDLQTRIQNGDYQLLLFLAAPVIATLFVCIKGIPGLLRGLAASVLGIISGCDVFFAVYWLDHYVFKGGLLLGESGLGVFLTVILAFISLSVGVAGGLACGRVQE